MAFWQEKITNSSMAGTKLQNRQSNKLILLPIIANSLRSYSYYVVLSISSQSTRRAYDRQFRVDEHVFLKWYREISTPCHEVKKNASYSRRSPGANTNRETELKRKTQFAQLRHKQMLQENPTHPKSPSMRVLEYLIFQLVFRPIIHDTEFKAPEILLHTDRERKGKSQNSTATHQTGAKSNHVLTEQSVDEANNLPNPP